jgi:hypothetical protein
VHSLAKLREFDEQEIDCHAYVDITLNLSENKHTMKEVFPDKLAETQYVRSITEEVKAKEREDYQKQDELYREEIAKKETELLEGIKNTDPDPVLDKHFGQMRNLVGAFDNSKINLLVLYGQMGSGKTHTVLTELSKTHSVDNLRVVAGHATLLRLYQILYECRGMDNVVILDDIPMNTLKNPLFTALLKAACWSDTQRTVSWASTSSVLEKDSIPQQFVFEGKIVLLANELPNNDDFRAVCDRGILKEIMYSVSDLKEIIMALAKHPFGILTEPERLEVADWVIGKLSPALVGISIRSLIKTLMIRESRPDKWKDIASEFFVIDEMKQAYIEAVGYSGAIADQVEHWVAHTGLSRSSFYRCRRKMG